jgi:fluoride exporter
MLALFVGLAASAGAVARFLLDQVVQSRHDAVFPFGTLVVNVSGSFLLGLLTGLSLHHGLPTGPTVVASAGFAGGYTTCPRGRGRRWPWPSPPPGWRHP